MCVFKILYYYSIQLIHLSGANSPISVHYMKFLDQFNSLISALKKYSFPKSTRLLSVGLKIWFPPEEFINIKGLTYLEFVSIDPVFQCKL